MNAMFFITNALLGAGLAMDAMSVSIADGLADPAMRRRDIVRIATVFAFFQALMPMVGWVCVHTIVEVFSFFGKLVPWIALGLLGYIGGKMIYDGVREGRGDKDGIEEQRTTGRAAWRTLAVQGIATSIDALSVGFTIASYTWVYALAAVAVIAAVTFVLCSVGVVVGRTVGDRFSGKATVVGGVILVLIGLEIFVSGLVG